MKLYIWIEEDRLVVEQREDKHGQFLALPYPPSNTTDGATPTTPSVAPTGQSNGTMDLVFYY